jgi:carbonic anhydrase
MWNENLDVVSYNHKGETSMRSKQQISLIGLVLALSLLLTAGIAAAHDGPVPAADGEVIAEGFNGPQGLLVDGDGNVWVIDSGLGGEGDIKWISAETGEEVDAKVGDSAQVARINAGDNSVDMIAALPSVNLGAEAIGGARLALLDGTLYATVGQGIGAPESEVPDNFGGVLTIGADGALALVASTWDFEVANNPHPSILDSHPYGLEPGPDGMLYIADAGGNDLLKLDPATGEISVVAVFDPIPGVFPRPDYGGEMLTDAVPTDVVFDGEGNVYVSYLSGAPFVPGSAKVVMVAPDGTVSDYATGYTMLTDLAWGPDGHLYGVQFGVFGEQGPTPNSGSVVDIHPGEEPVVAIEGLSFPIAIDFNEAGDAFVAINAVGPPGSGAVLAFHGLAPGEMMEEEEEHHEAPHWGYEGEVGPEHWGELNPDWALCSTGVEQSPVDIPADTVVNPADITFGYDPSQLTIVNNGHTIQVNYDPGSTIEVGGKSYELKQFHFHALSEHTMAGANTPMEMHLVHQAEDGQYAVVGVFINSGDANAAFEPIWANLPAEAGDPTAIDGVMVNADDLLPGERTYYRYNGSFTTPPCTEGVQWLVLNTDISLSDEQIGAFTDIVDGNYRPVQALNDREFFLTSPAMEEPAPEPTATPAPAPETLPETGADLSGSTPVWPVWVFVVVAGALVGGFVVYRRRAA